MLQRRSLSLEPPFDMMDVRIIACTILGRVLSSFWFGNLPALERRSEMAWKTPRIVEVPVGMEINMYACAARK